MACSMCHSIHYYVHAVPGINSSIAGDTHILPRTHSSASDVCWGWLRGSFKTTPNTRDMQFTASLSLGAWQDYNIMITRVSRHYENVLVMRRVALGTSPQSWRVAAGSLNVRVGNVLLSW